MRRKLNASRQIKSSRGIALVIASAKRTPIKAVSNMRREVVGYGDHTGLIAHHVSSARRGIGSARNETRFMTMTTSDQTDVAITRAAHTGTVNALRKKSPATRSTRIATITGFFAIIWATGH
jgi:hypothetical protein